MEDINKIRQLPALKKLDISTCEESDVRELLPILLSGCWQKVDIPCIGGDPIALGNYLNRINSPTEITVMGEKI